MNANDFAVRSQIQYDVWEEVDRQNEAGRPTVQYVGRDILVRIAAYAFRVLEQADREARAR